MALNRMTLAPVTLAVALAALVGAPVASAGPNDVFLDELATLNVSIPGANAADTVAAGNQVCNELRGGTSVLDEMSRRRGDFPAAERPGNALRQRCDDESLPRLRSRLISAGACLRARAPSTATVVTPGCSNRLPIPTNVCRRKRKLPSWVGACWQTVGAAVGRRRLGRGVCSHDLRPGDGL